MGLYTPPPPARPFSEDKATVLTSWWITCMCAIIIVFRLIGRYVRVEALFGEDKVAAVALVPLFLRMAFVHPMLLFGTNNVLLDDASPMGEEELHRREIASRLVLVSRILHPAILWLLKIVTLEFFDRLVGLSGKNRYTLLLRFTRVSLAASFLAIVVANLAECRPFAHYWQVAPDPGGQCRQGYAQLLTVTVCNIFTDLVLVVFPVPIVVKSRLSVGRKTLLVMLFCLHLFTVVVAVYKVPEILREDGYQATRTMWASAEILMATFAANVLTIGTFVRDTGVKKRRFQPYQQPTESELRSSRRDSRGGKKVTWHDADSDGGEEGGRQAAGMAREPEMEDGLKRPAPVLEHSEDRMMRRTESSDSLIPRGRFLAPVPSPTPPPEARVLKTTTIEVTVSPATTADYEGAGGGLVLRPADGVVTASARGRARGGSVPLRDLSSLPHPDGGHTSPRGDV